jgi:uncharacterized linocin/CFP29 family protein
MNHLRLELSPILPRAYELVAAKAREALVAYLAARKLVDFDGPRGFAFSALALGRTDAVAFGGAEARLRKTQPMLELRVPFELSLAELDNVERGADDLDVDAVAVAARQLAALEDEAVFYGVAAAGIEGMVPASRRRRDVIQPSKDFPDLVSQALAQLRAAGVEGPFAIALNRDAYEQLLSSTGPGGYPTLQHIRKLVDGPTVFAPALRGDILVLSLRGGDFELTIGQDVSIGYLSHDQETVRLYLEETLTFRVLGPEAVVSLPASVP